MPPRIVNVVNTCTAPTPVKDIMSYNSTLTQENVTQLCKTYNIVGELKARAPEAHENMGEVPSGSVGIYVNFLAAGLRFPISPLLRAILGYYDINIGQLHPNGYRKILCFELLCKALGIEPILDLYRHFYYTSELHGWYTFSNRPCHKTTIITGLKVSVKYWQDKFFWILDPLLFGMRSGCSNRGKQDRIPKLTAVQLVSANTLSGYTVFDQNFPEEVLVAAGMSQNSEYDNVKLNFLDDKLDVGLIGFLTNNSKSGLISIKKSPVHVVRDPVVIMNKVRGPQQEVLPPRRQSHEYVEVQDLATIVTSKLLIKINSDDTVNPELAEIRAYFTREGVGKSVTRMVDQLVDPSTPCAQMTRSTYQQSKKLCRRKIKLDEVTVGQHAMVLRPKKNKTKDHAAQVGISTKKRKKSAMVPCVSGIQSSLCKGKTMYKDQDKDDNEKNALVVYQQSKHTDFICDLNAPPHMVADSQVGPCLSLHFTPLTPDPARKGEHKQVASDAESWYGDGRMDLDEQPQINVSTLVETNDELEMRITEKANLNDTPQSQQRKRKHTQIANLNDPEKSRKAKSPKPETSKSDGSLSGKRKYVRKKLIENSKSCNRKLNFDEVEKGVEVEVEQERDGLMPPEVGCHEKNVMVLYQQDGSLVPDEGLLHPVKKPKLHPKVVIDDESSGVWSLLSGDIYSEIVDGNGTDEDKEKLREEGQRLLCGRADSFIARMHLAQGNRRFSRWKGSVLDSVVGAFLTQNVTDVLSSSAFMSLASKFPLRSTSCSEPLSEEIQIESVKKSCQMDEDLCLMMLHETNSHEDKEVVNCTYDNSECGVLAESECQETITMVNRVSFQESAKSCNICEVHEVLDATNVSSKTFKAAECNSIVEASAETQHKTVKSKLTEHCSHHIDVDEGSQQVKKQKPRKQQNEVDWDNLRLEAEIEHKRERMPDTMDSMDYEAVMNADVHDIADAIKERGMQNNIGGRIKDMLKRLVEDHGSINLEWLRDVPPEKTKEYLLSIRGLGLKSVECIRLLSLQHLAFPVDTNVGRIAVRLGWVPLQPLPESLQLHILEQYPFREKIQQYLWPRLCKLDQKTLYEIHYHMITLGKVFCTKIKPNCNACPMRGECKHYASAFASARLALPSPNQSTKKEPATLWPIVEIPATPGPIIEELETIVPLVEMPASPEPEIQMQQEHDIEDFNEDWDQTLQNYVDKHTQLGQGDMSKAIVAITSEAASAPPPKPNNVSQLRTEHHVYVLPDSHHLVEGLDKREPDDPSPYLLAVWTPDSIQPSEGTCRSQKSGILCKDETCSFCNSTRESNSLTVRGTFLIPCRTAMRGSFPLNGTYFQVNEVFADHASSLNPIEFPRSCLRDFQIRKLYFGTTISAIVKGLTPEAIEDCFWEGFVCMRGFDRKTRAPRPLIARLHFPSSKQAKKKPTEKRKKKSL